MNDNIQKKDQDMTFEEALKLLEETVAKLEKEEVGLEQAFDLYSKGVKLAGLCNSMIENIESKITLLSEDKDGVPGEEEIEL